MRRLNAAKSRRLVAISAAVYLTIATLRSAVPIVLGYYPEWPSALRYVALVLLVVLFWVPTTALIVTSVRGVHHRGGFMLLHGAGLAVVLAIEPYWAVSMIRFMDARAGGMYVDYVTARFGTNIVMYLSVIGIAWATEYDRRRVDAERTEVRLDAAQSEVQLHALTMQLHPHFLFNTLNLISQLAYDDPPSAQQLLAHLRALLLQSLDHTMQHETPLRDELRFLHAYLAIQRARFGDRLIVTVNTPFGVLDAWVPRLILQPIVENAIRHGVALRPAGGRVDITIARKGDHLEMAVRDDGVGLPGGRLGHKEGFGLANTRRRLQHLYPGDHALVVVPAADGGTTATITMPLQWKARVPAAPEDVAPLATDDVAASVTVPDAELRWDAWSGIVATARTRKARLSRGLISVTAAWAVIALAWTQLGVVTETIAGRTPAWRGLGVAYGLIAALWVLTTPVVVWLSRRIAAAEHGRVVAGVAHLVGSLTIATVHLWLLLVLLRTFGARAYAAVDRAFLPWLVWNVIVYLMIVTFTQVAILRIRYHNRLHAVERARGALTRARLTTLRMQLQPSILLTGLDAVTSAVNADADLCERVISRMGDMLRQMMAHAGRETVPLRDELASLRAFADVRSARGATADWRMELRRELLDRPIPAGLLTQLLASLVGEPSGVHAWNEDHALCLAVRVRRRALGYTLVDAASKASLETRLGALYGRDWVLAVSLDSDSATANFRAPLFGAELILA